MNRQVFGRHGFGNNPTGESVPFGYGVFGHSDCCTDGVGLFGIELTVDGVGQRVFGQ